MKQLSEIIETYLERTRLSLANARGLLWLSLIGLVSGVVVGGVVILFRVLIETAQTGILPGADPENYESLAADERVLILMSGSIALGLLFFLVSRAPLRVGVIHVMERLAYHEGHLPFKNALMQFIGGAIAIISGHSVGREGPCIHLGAAGASLLGQWLQLPNNSIRTLVACGTAAAIAASFNTPLAGVIFAMEVVVMEYTITGFTPVILAAVSATTVNRIVFDAAPVFHVPAHDLASYWELPAVVVMGVGIGALAALFIICVKWVTYKGLRLPVWLSMTAAGMGVGICAWVSPEVMGVGYDTVNEALSGNIALTALLVILLFKLIATVISAGMGIPAGFISPVLFMGAIAGSATGLLMAQIPGTISPPGFYAMLGMGAMMGAALQAPLAALLALLELTANQHMIFPGMLAIVSASLATRELFGQKSIYLSQMQGIGLDYRNDPVTQSLRRFAVGSVMDREFSIIGQQMDRVEAKNMLVETKPQWLIISREQGNLLLPAADLARYIEESEEEVIDMLEIPSKRLQMAPVLEQATLQYAHKLLHESEVEVEALYVIRTLGPKSAKIYGIVTRHEIEEGYRTRNTESFY